MNKTTLFSSLIATLVLSLASTFIGTQLRAQERLQFQNLDYQVTLEQGRTEVLFVIEGWMPSTSDPIRIPARVVEIPLKGGTSRSYELANVELDTSVRATPFYYAEYERTSDTTFNTSLHAAPVHLRPDADYSVLRILSQQVIRRRQGSVLQVVVPLVVTAPDGSTAFVRRFELREVSPDARAIPPRVVEEVPSFYAGMPFVRRSGGALDTSGTWIDHTETYRVFSVRQDGVYRIDKIWLSQAGYDTSSLNPAQVQLLNRGKAVALAEVGLDDGVFDATDGFLFYGSRNYDPGDYKGIPSDPDAPYPQFMSKYSDSSSYFLHMESSNNTRRAIHVQSPATTSTDTLNWFYQKIHVENDVYLFSYSSRVERMQYAEWTSEDSFWAGWMGPGTAQYNIHTPYLHPGVPARVAVRAGTWYGPANNELSFISSVRVNESAVVDSSAQPNIAGWVLRGSVPSSDLRPDTNKVYFRNHSTSSDPRTFLFDWYELEYPRSLVATGDAISFVIDSTVNPAVRPIRVTNFTGGNIVVLRIRDTGVARIQGVVRQSGAAWEVVFTDTIVPGVRYAVALAEAAVRPAVPQAVQIEDLRDRQAAQYLLITCKELRQSADRYAAMLRRQYGLGVRVTNVEDIYSNYSYGYFNPEAIKLYVYDALSRWKTPALKYVMLAGDANHHLRASSARFGKNFVPTYGYPAGDTWFVSFDSLSVTPQLALGRLPVRSEAELDAYRTKHEKYVTGRLDDWNKTFMFFSSGDPAEGEANLLSYRNVNSGIIRNTIEPPPLAGRAVHFYKTINPRTDLGPYEPSYISTSIDEGALMISYIGHSGTQTWDNSIGDVSQLANKRGRSPLISDFGCSTGKFAEPDVTPFAELFVSDVNGAAIGYIGNSSLGFQSTARTLPPLFYSIVVTDRSERLGDAHGEMKRRLIANYGNNIVNRISVLSNTLVGDPVVTIPVPTRTNMIVRSNWIMADNDIIKDESDSAVFHIAYANYGTQEADSVTVDVTSTHAGTTTVTTRIRRVIPAFIDTIRLAIPVRDMSGQHELSVTLDPENLLDEQYEDDNQAVLQFNVASTKIKVVNQQIERIGSMPADVRLLNPLYNPGMVPSLELEISSSDLFQNPVRRPVTYGSVISSTSNIASVSQGTNYWRITSTNAPNAPVGPYRYHGEIGSYSLLLADSTGFRNGSSGDMQIENDTLRMKPAERRVQLISAGFLDGSFGVVSLDGVNILPTTFFRSYAVVLIDSLSMQPYAIRYYDLLGDPTSADSLNQFVLTARPGTIFAITTADEPRARNNLVAPTLRALGSKFIGTLGDRSSWAMIGWRGAATGTIPEKYANSTAGRVIVDTVFSVQPDTSKITIANIGPAARWSHLDVMRSQHQGVFYSARVSSTRSKQELMYLDNVPARIDLSSIDAQINPYIDLSIRMYASSHLDSAYIASIGIKYDDLPELALNYQSVAMRDTSVEQGDSARVDVGVLNPGQGRAKGFTIALDLIDEQNIRRPYDSIRVTGLSQDEWIRHTFAISSTALKGRYQAVISVDRNDEVAEQYEDNNVYTTSFSVRQDTMRPSLDITFDDVVVMDGDYVRPRPIVRVALKDLSPLPVTSPQNFRIVVNDSLIPMTTGNVRIIETSPHAILEYVPSSDLEAGENIFAFNATDVSGNKAYDADIETRVRVSYDGGLERVYNHPNPFSDATVFSFLLIGATPPEDANIYIYTVSGRKIATISIPPSQLRIGYNVVRWDGRDDDGDRLANGTYFFKLSIRSSGVPLEQTGRIAVMR